MAAWFEKQLLEECCRIGGQTELLASTDEGFLVTPPLPALVEDRLPSLPRMREALRDPLHELRQARCKLRVEILQGDLPGTSDVNLLPEPPDVRYAKTPASLGQIFLCHHAIEVQVEPFTPSCVWAAELLDEQLPEILHCLGRQFLFRRLRATGTSRWGGGRGGRCCCKIGLAAPRLGPELRRHANKQGAEILHADRALPQTS
mmetsp:Transcript_51223/g.147082  ORF Transcript_51223/g.147082 Transcript_51223/m.147082 type:complete len:203 (+) Transcript_51223:428-1036(+)